MKSIEQKFSSPQVIAQIAKRESANRLVELGFQPRINMLILAGKTHDEIALELAQQVGMSEIHVRNAIRQGAHEGVFTANTEVQKSSKSRSNLKTWRDSNPEDAINHAIQASRAAAEVAGPRLLGLDPDLAMQVIQKISMGISDKAIASEFNLTPAQVKKWRNPSTRPRWAKQLFALIQPQGSNPQQTDIG